MTTEVFFLMPAIMDNVADLLPEEIRILNVHIKDIGLSGFEIDPARAKFEIDKSQKGIMLNWAKLVNYRFHSKFVFKLFWPLTFSFNIDLKMKDVLLDNGFSIKADNDKGTPIIKFFNTHVDLGHS